MVPSANIPRSASLNPNPDLNLHPGLAGIDPERAEGAAEGPHIYLPASLNTDPIQNNAVSREDFFARSS
jgi:hypothetical protein